MFGTEKYINLLNNLQKNGFIFSTFEDATMNPDGRRIALRHDVDFSLESALEISALEKKMGISSIYFFMLTSNMYNLLSDKSKLIVKEIASNGHQASIHFDPTCYKNSSIEGFKMEYATFKSSFNDLPAPELVSIHRPGNFLNDNNQRLPNVEHTYQDKYFRKMNYYSDSGGRDISDTLNKLEPNPRSGNIQILLHPIWWTCRTASPTETLLKFINNNAKTISEETSKNCKTYNPNQFTTSSQ